MTMRILNLSPCTFSTHPMATIRTSQFMQNAGRLCYNTSIPQMENSLLGFCTTGFIARPGQDIGTCDQDMTWRCSTVPEACWTPIHKMKVAGYSYLASSPLDFTAELREACHFKEPHEATNTWAGPLREDAFLRLSPEIVHHIFLYLSLAEIRSFVLASSWVARCSSQKKLPQSFWRSRFLRGYELDFAFSPIFGLIGGRYFSQHDALCRTLHYTQVFQTGRGYGNSWN